MESVLRCSPICAWANKGKQMAANNILYGNLMIVNMKWLQHCRLA